MKKNWSRLDPKRNNFTKISILLPLIAIMLLLQACGTSSTADLSVGSPAPEFTLPTSSGEEVSLDDFIGQQPVLLYFHMADG